MNGLNSFSIFNYIIYNTTLLFYVNTKFITNLKNSKNY